MSLAAKNRERVFALRREGATYLEIAQLTGLSKSVVNNILNRVSTARRCAKGSPRACLCCGATFKSEGPHNRLCNACRRRSLTVFDTPASVVRR